MKTKAIYRKHYGWGKFGHSTVALSITLAILGATGTGANAAPIVVINPSTSSETLTLIPNGDFEANSSGTPTSWTYSNPGHPISFQLSSEQSFFGANSAKAVSSISHTGPGIALVNTAISTILGETYVLGGYFYYDNITTSNLYIDVSDVATDPNLSPPHDLIPSDTWVFAYDTFTAQATTTQVRLVFDSDITPDQFGYIDGVSVTRFADFVAPVTASVAVPVPATIWLFGLGLFGLIAINGLRIKSCKPCRVGNAVLPTIYG